MPSHSRSHVTNSHIAGCLTAVLLAAPASAAIVNEQSIAIDVRADGTVREQVTLRVTIERDADLDRWSPYPIFLDSHRRLLEVDATVTPAGGSTRKVSRKRRDRTGMTGENVLHSSQEAELVEFPAVPPGSTLQLAYAVEERPYFPSGMQWVGGEDAIEQLRLQVRGAGPTFRYQLAGPVAGLVVEESSGGVIVRGALPSLPEVPRTPEPAGVVLRYAWGGGADWSAVGRWYTELVGQVPRGSPQVREVARQLAGKTREETLAQAVDFVRTKVRYVAVEVGVGGYRPTPPAEVLARRWGDCKDKSLLLVDLLAAAGIEGRLALAQAGDESYIVPAFAAPDGFDHEIVAVSASGLKLPAGAPVVDGWLFLDATQEEGGLTWLHPAARGRPVLLVDTGGGRLIDIPVAPAAESRHLSVELTLGPDGVSRGRVRFEASGALAVWLADAAAAGPTGLTEAAALLADDLPGGGLTGIKVESAHGVDGTPVVTLTADVRLVSTLTVAGNELSLVLPGGPGTPEPSLLDAREAPLELRPGIQETTWRIELPQPGCTAEGGDARREEAVGAFEQQVALTGRTLTVHRRTELRRRQVAGGEAAALASLSVAERRALKKRLRLRCGG